MNTVPDIILGLQIFLDHRSLSSIDQKILIGHWSFKSTYGANKGTVKEVQNGLGRDVEMVIPASVLLRNDKQLGW